MGDDDTEEDAPEDEPIIPMIDHIEWRPKPIITVRLGTLEAAREIYPTLTTYWYNRLGGMHDR